jgi:NAD(P)H dehydrogenase (quinone)
VPFDEFAEELAAAQRPGHVLDHLRTMARLHRANRYDRATHDVEEILGRPASGVADYITMNPELFPR